MAVYNNIGAEIYIGVDGSGDAEPHNTDRTLAQYEAQTWLKIGQVGNFGATGTTTNVTTYDTLDTTVSQKAPGIRNAGDPEMEYAFSETDLGQIQLRAAAASANANNSYVFKKQENNGSRVYNRGIVTGPVYANGGPEDFKVETVTLGLNQEQIIASS